MNVKCLLSSVVSRQEVEKKNTFSVPLAQLADLNGEMLSFKEQDIFHISSDTPATLI